MQKRLFCFIFAFEGTAFNDNTDVPFFHFGILNIQDNDLIELVSQSYGDLSRMKFGLDKPSVMENARILTEKKASVDLAMTATGSRPLHVGAHKYACKQILTNFNSSILQ